MHSNNIPTITTANWHEYAIAHIPSFGRYWNAHLSEWDGEPAGIHLDVGVLVATVLGAIEVRDGGTVERAAKFIESMIVHGDHEVRDAAKTSVLESLLNLISANRIQAKDVVPHLQSASITFCKQWDAFTGVDTPGVKDR